MKLGLFLMPLHPPHRPMHETIAENTDKILHADALGFNEVWVGEHFSARTEPLSSPMMLMASLIHRTKNLTFGTGVIGLPNHHPVIVAAEAAQFDHMSQGRFIFGFGPAGLASDHELFGNTDPAVRNERLMESIDIIVKLWTQEPPYDIKGKHWHVKLTEEIVPELGIGYLPRTFQKPHPPIAISAMSPVSESVKTAAKRGWSPISANFMPEYAVGSQRNIWRAAEEAGASRRGLAGGPQYRGRRDQQAPTALDPKGSNHYYFPYSLTPQRANYTMVMKPDPKQPDTGFTAEQLIKSMVVYGSAETVAEKILAPAPHRPFRDAADGLHGWQRPEPGARMGDDAQARHRRHARAARRAHPGGAATTSKCSTRGLKTVRNFSSSG
jgi:alkanesulfonate monooxygenase SsuD/methylene tetrahydromethanopterin reductase-like flavin-dependent oxidoreductase (luciferase family)